MNLAEAEEAQIAIEPPPPKAKRRSKTKDTPRTKTQPPYAVIVENDEFHTWMYVIEVLQKVFGYGEEKAYLLTAQVHFSGQAIVWSGALEVAELKSPINLRLRPRRPRVEAGRIPARRPHRATAGLKRRSYDPTVNADEPWGAGVIRLSGWPRLRD